MKLYNCFLMSVLMAASVFGQNLPYKEGELLVKYRSEVSTSERVGIQAVVQTKKVLHSYKFIPGLELLQLEKNTSTDEAIAALQNNPDVYYAEPNYTVNQLDTVPSCSGFGLQWGLRNLAQAGIDMNAVKAWDVTTGSQSVVVAIIDTGVDYNHPDLKPNIWTDPNGNASSGNSHGCNPINPGNEPMDDEGHGTHVAGIIGAAGGRTSGVVGVNWRVKILACKFLDSSGGGNLSDAIKSMEYILALKKRLKNPVNIVATNNSWGGGGYSQAMYDAIKAQQAAGILFIAAAGNEKSNNDITDTYPANYKLENVISVAAHDRYGTLPVFSNRGKNSVHVAAPGVDIYSTYPGASYSTLSGTSMAAPFATGLAALIKASHPEYMIYQIKNLMMSSGKPSSATQQTTISGRRLLAWGNNNSGALNCSNQILARLVSPMGTSQVVSPNDEVVFSYLYVNCADAAGSKKLDIDVNGSPGLSLYDDGQNGDAIANDGLYIGMFRAPQPGKYVLKFPDSSTFNIQVADISNRYLTAAASLPYTRINGIPLNLGDETTAVFKAPFPIRLGSPDNSYDTLYVASDGTISLTSNFVNFRNQPLPLGGMQTLIAPFWDNLSPQNSGGLTPALSYVVKGQAPARQLIVEWKNMPRYGVFPSRQNAVTFQVVFYENNSDVRFNYAKSSFGDSDYDNGKTATIGVQIAEKNATLFSFKKKTLSDNFSILFSLNQPKSNP